MVEEEEEEEEEEEDEEEEVVVVVAILEVEMTEDCLETAEGKEHKGVETRTESAASIREESAELAKMSIQQRSARLEKGRMALVS